MKTYSTRASEVRRTWHVLDATNIPLGRLATQAASLIRGKHKVIYAPNMDTGDYVVVVNARKVVLTGRKPEQKKYYHHSQYPGGLKTRTVREVIEKNASRVIEHAVHGMLPHNRLGRELHGHLKVYNGPDHPHAAQVNGPAQPALSQPPVGGRTRASRRAGRAAVAPPATAAAAPVAVAAAVEPEAPEEALGAEVEAETATENEETAE